MKNKSKEKYSTQGKSMEPNKSKKAKSIVTKPKSNTKKEVESNSNNTESIYEPRALTAEELRLAREKALKLLKNTSEEETSAMIKPGLKPVTISVATTQKVEPAIDLSGESDFYYDSDEISTIYSSPSLDE